MFLVFGISLWFVGCVDAVPQIDFTAPTPDNNTLTSNTSIEINVSITESNLEEMKFNWNNVSYTFYDDSLVLMMNFDNVSALGENDTYVVDVSNYSNNGTTSGDPVMNLTGGKYGGAFEFDGVDDYVEISNSESLNITNEITMMAWVKTGQSHNGGIISKSDGGSWTAYALRLYNGYPQIFINGGFVYTSSGIADNNWHHLVAIYDGFNMALYVDGSLGVYKATTGGDIATNNNDVTIGLARNVYFNGTIDEVIILNKSLSDAEIKQYYYSNLYKYDIDKWAFYSNQSSLSEGTYTYQAHSQDLDGNLNSTEVRNVMTLAEITLNSPEDGAYFTSLNPILNVTVKNLEGDNMNVSFYNSDGGLIGTDNNIANGSQATYQWTGLSKRTTYEWYVNVTDNSSTTTSPVWSFETTGSVLNIPSAGTTRIELNTTGSAIGHKLVWRQNYTGDWDQMSSATIENGIIYFNSMYCPSPLPCDATEGFNGTLSVNLTTGELIWYTPTFPSNGQPEISGDRIIVGSYGTFSNLHFNGKVYALNKTDGSILWTYTTPGTFVYFQPAVAEGKVFTTGFSGAYPYNNMSYALNLTTGEQIWNYTIECGIVGSPTVVDGVVYIGTDENSTCPTNIIPVIYAINATNGTQIWNYTNISLDAHDMSPTITENLVILPANNDGIFALNKSNGSLVWYFKLEDRIHSMPAVHNGKIYFGTGFGSRGHVYALNKTNGSLIWNFTVPTTTNWKGLSKSSPAVASGMVFIAGLNGFFYAINESDGDLLWSYDNGKNSFWAPSVAEGKVIFGNDNWYLYAFDFGDGAGNWIKYQNDQNRSGYTSDGLTTHRYVKVDCSTANVTTCNITNYYNKSITNVYLRSLDNISSVKLSDDIYNIYIKAEKLESTQRTPQIVNYNDIYLPQIPALSNLTNIEIKNGTYNNSIPRLTDVAIGVDVLNAEYNQISKEVNITLDGTGTNKNISVIYNVTENFLAKDNDYTFATISSGIITNSNSSYFVSYDTSTGVFNFTLPTMSEHEIILQEDNINPTPSFSCTPTSVYTGQTITCSCTATDAVDSSPSVSYTINPSTSSTGTYTTTCTATDDAGNSATSSISYTVSSSDGGGGTPSFWINTFVKDEKEFSEIKIITRELKAKERVRIKIKDESHYIGVAELTNTTATIEIFSTSQKTVFNVGNENKFEVTDDEYYDIYVRLNSILDNKANLTMMSIHEEIPFEEESVTEDVVEVVEEQNLTWLGIVFVVIILVIVVSVLFSKRKGKN